MELFEHAFPIEDGVIHGPNGKYMFPAVGTAKPKELSKNKVIILAVTFVVVAALAIVVASYLGDTGIRELELYKELYALVGKSVDEVPQQIIPLVQENKGEYRYDGTVEYLGADLDVYLYFEENAGLLDKFAYTTSYNADDRTAAVNISRFLDQFYQGDVLELEAGSVNVGKKALLQMFREGENLFLDLSQDITPAEGIPGDSVVQYLEYLEGSEYYDGRIGEYLTKEARFYRDIRVEYAPKEGVVRTTLCLTVESDRNKK